MPSRFETRGGTDASISISRLHSSGVLQPSGRLELAHTITIEREKIVGYELIAGGIGPNSRERESQAP
jgi:hypothetical protein